MPEINKLNVANNEEVKFSPQRVKRRMIIYIGLTLFLFFTYLELRSSNWVSSSLVHTVMETIASVLAFQVGVMALVSYYSKKNIVLLMLGTGFIGTGFLDTYHTVITAAPIILLFPSPEASQIAWSWIASRGFLSVFMFLSWFYWYRENNFFHKKKVKEFKVYLASIIFTIFTFFFFIYTPLPSPYTHAFFFKRPWELFPAFFFLIALIGYLFKGKWKDEYLEHWIVLSLIVNFMGQAMFMSFSNKLYDVMFDAAHFLKQLSYICVLIGLLISMFRLFMKAEQANFQLKKSKEELQDIVKERTLDLENKNEELVGVIEDLKSTQARLITQEKLAALGGLTAGIAHEIKNPLNFINNFSEISIESISKISTSLSEDLGKVEPTKAKAIQKKLENVSGMLSKIYAHGKKANNIVQAMLLHARGSGGTFTNVNINDLIEEYVNLAYHGMRSRDVTFQVKFEKHYDPTLETVEIVAEDFGRVILNFVNNASYSIHRKKQQLGETYIPIISIITQNLGDKFAVIIRDNGMGVSQNVKEKLFTPFFTTKPLGEGTGLGLSISYDIIVNMLHGTVSIATKENDFFEITILLQKKRIKTG